MPSLNSILRDVVLKIPPIARVYTERNNLAIEVRRLQRELDQRPKSESPTVGFDASKFSKKINLGCGADHKIGYLNVDLNSFFKPDLVADAKNLHMLPSGEYDELFASDVLEHLHRDDTEVALKEWARLLKPGGLLFVRVPSILDVARQLNQTPENQIAKQKAIVQNLFGTQAYTGDYHFTAFTKPLLASYLADAGFNPISWGLHEDWMLEVKAIRQ